MILLKAYNKKSLTDYKPKRIRRYDGTHVNIASFVNRFRLSRKTEPGINRIMVASLRARFTHHKSLHDKISIASARIHVYETKHGKKKFIACKDQLQQPWQN